MGPHCNVWEVTESSRQRLPNCFARCIAPGMENSPLAVGPFLSQGETKFVFVKIHAHINETSYAGRALLDEGVDSFKITKACTRV